MIFDVVVDVPFVGLVRGRANLQIGIVPKAGALPTALIPDI